MLWPRAQMINAFEVEEALPFVVYESASDLGGSSDNEAAAAAALHDAGSTDRTHSEGDSENGATRRPVKRVKRCAGRVE